MNQKRAFYHQILDKYLLPVALAIIGAMSLLPFVVLCWYAHPSADDFLTGNQVREHGHWGYIGYMYTQWTGRYTSATLWGLLNPVAYGNIKEGYGLVCLLVLVLVPIAIFLLIYALLANQCRKRYLWLSSGVLTALFLFQMPSPAEGFYWITSDYNYMVPACLTLLWLASLVRHANATNQLTRRNWLLVAALLAVLIVGGNETNALPMLIGVTSFTVLQCIKHHRIEWDYIFLSVVVVIACAAAFLAPGNFVRLSQSGRQYGMLESADRAALAAYRCLINWIGNGVIISITILLLPLSYRLSRIPNLPLNRLAQKPFFITLLLPVSIITVLFLAEWTTSMSMPPRSRNVLYLFFLIGWFIHAHGWAQLFWHRFPSFTISIPSYGRWLLTVWLVWVFFMGSQYRMRGREQLENTNNILLAYKDWLSGAAARYDAQLTARYVYLQSWSPNDVVVEPLQNPPMTILFSDLQVNTDDWANLAYADFFGKSSIRIKAEPPASGSH